MAVARTPLETRFWSRVAVAGRDECWLWSGCTDTSGYGRISIGGKAGRKLQAHRVAWEFANNTHPGDGFVCHTCDNRRCVNPAHLWLGDCAANIRDMVAKGRHANQRKTHCPHGHEYTPENTIVRRVGRGCRACLRARRSRR